MASPLDKMFCQLEEARVVLLGVPYDGNPNETSGSRYAPEAIRKDLARVFAEDEDLEALKVHDAGNVGIIHGERELARKAITNEARTLTKANPNAALIVLGGEHSITLPVIEALMPKNCLCFDVHFDLRDPTGTLMEHESLNRQLLDLGVNVELRGAKIGSADEKKQAATLKPVRDPVYVSIDLDVLSDVPVSTGFSGNLGFNELWNSIKEREILACDLTGYNPLLGKSLVPAQLVRKLILKLNQDQNR